MIDIINGAFGILFLFFASRAADKGDTAFTILYGFLYLGCVIILVGA